MMMDIFRNSIGYSSFKMRLQNNFVELKQKILVFEEKTQSIRIKKQELRKK